MTDSPLPAYQGDEAFAFISYSHADEAIVFPEARWLQEQGFPLWYDAGISGASRWRDAIAGRIAACHLFVLYVSSNSAASQVCREELEYALDQGKPVLAIHLEPAELPDGMRLGITNRQALLRHQLTDEDYERSLVAVLSSYLGATEDARTRSLPVIRPRRGISIAVFSAAIVVAAITGALLTRLLATDESTPQIDKPLEYTIELNRGEMLTPGNHDSLAISQDGELIIWSVLDQDLRQVFRRRSTDSRADTDIHDHGGSLWSLSLSPDKRWLAFHDDGALQRVGVNGGSPTRLADIPPRGGFFGHSWLDNRTLIFPDRPGLMSISRDGGEISVLVPHAMSGGSFVAQPGSMDGKAVFYTRIDWNGQTKLMIARIEAGAMVGEPAVLLENASQGKLMNDGLLVFSRDRALWAVAFDEDELALTGEPVRVLDDVLFATTGSWAIPVARYDLSKEGTLAYQPRSSEAIADRPNVPTIIDRSGNRQPLPIEPKGYRTLTVSPDGCCFATQFNTDGQTDLWTYHLDRNTWTRVTNTRLPNSSPVWSPSGDELAFSSLTVDETNSQPPNVSRVSVRGDRPPVQVTTGSAAIFADDWWHPSTLLVRRYALADEREEVGEITIPGGSYTALVQSQDNAAHPRLSPDGRWLAYIASSTGDWEVYVRPYPNVDDDLITVSSGGGVKPEWHPAGDELFFVSRNKGVRELVAVPFADGRIGPPEVLFSIDDTADRADYAVMPDGDRFLFAPVVALEELPNDRIVVVRHFDHVVRAALYPSQQ